MIFLDISADAQPDWRLRWVHLSHIIAQFIGLPSHKTGPLCTSHCPDEFFIPKMNTKSFSFGRYSDPHYNDICS